MAERALRYATVGGAVVHVKDGGWSCTGCGETGRLYPAGNKAANAHAGECRAIPEPEPRRRLRLLLWKRGA